ncbi:MAG: AMP-binding protein, partial [Planctomycetota bacterium]
MSPIDHPEVSLDPLTPTLLLQRSLRVFPERIAIVDGDEEWTYTRFAEEVGRLAGALRRSGIEAGDRVAVLLHNTAIHLTADFAMPLIEAPLVSINTRLGPGEIAYILEHSGARILLVDPELAEPLGDVLGSIPTVETVVEVPHGDVAVHEGALSYDAFVADAEVLPIVSTLEDENAVLAINYTSGTTGQPKGVMYSHRGAYLNALGQIGTHRLDTGTTFLWTLPLFHCNGWCMPWAVTGAAGRHICLRGVDAAEIIRLIDAYSVTHFNAAPTVLLMISSHEDAAGRHFEPPIRVCTGGAPPSPTLL